MTIQLGKYNFEGPFDTTSDLREQSGVYAILGGNGNGSEQWKIVDIGESEGIRSLVENQDHANCWKRQQHPRLTCAEHDCNELVRVRIEQTLRAEFNPPCGDR